MLLGRGSHAFPAGIGFGSTIRGQQQVVVKVTSISWIPPELLWRFMPTTGAQVNRPERGGLQSKALNVGIENLSIDSTGDGSQAMEFFNRQNRW